MFMRGVVLLLPWLRHHDFRAKVISLDAIGTRQADIDQLVRKLQAKAPHLALVDEAGPCGDWL